MHLHLEFLEAVPESAFIATLIVFSILVVFFILVRTSRAIYRNFFVNKKMSAICA
jgi:cbb3-type cytochrome oxidase subunit 3